MSVMFYLNVKKKVSDFLVLVLVFHVISLKVSKTQWKTFDSKAACFGCCDHKYAKLWMAFHQHTFKYFI